VSDTEKVSAKVPATVKAAAQQRVDREPGHPSLSYVVQELLGGYAGGRLDVAPHVPAGVDAATDAVLARVAAGDLSLNAAAVELGVSWPTARRMRDARARRLGGDGA